GARGRAIFEVEDTGPGIAPEDAARLFRPFAQAESGIQAHEGTGLGLVISRDFVRLMGGELMLATEVGCGSRFGFDIPLPAAHGEPIEERRRVVGLRPGQPDRRILVVDNDPDARRLLAGLLASIGLSTREAQDGEQAIEVWRGWRPHLVWMDMRMPVLSGYDATV